MKDTQFFHNKACKYKDDEILTLTHYPKVWCDGAILRGIRDDGLAEVEWVGHNLSEISAYVDPKCVFLRTDEYVKDSDNIVCLLAG